MKALRWYGRKDLRFVDVPEPSPGPGQLKVRVALAGICGTDLKEYASGPVMIAAEKAPITIGHEFAGKVAAVGKGVSDFRVGERVTGVGYYYCGECYVCKEGRYNLCVNQGFTGLFTDGCMAEYVIVPAYACYHLPDGVSDEAGAMVEPLAVALHAVRQARVQLGNTVAVVGDGTIGLCALLAAKAAGASEVYVVAKHRGRGELARALGATAVIYLSDGSPVSQLQKISGGPGADAAIECVGYPDTPQLTVELLRRGGIAVIVGVFSQPGTFEFSTMTFPEKIMVGSSIYVHEGQTAVDLLADGRIDASPLVTSLVPLKDAVKLGFEALLANKDANIKILLRVP
ncbi:MAG TPA: alcohol dehydrogenase catalytic domain-containing protein [Dehalococcoidales bacterium]|nr:alcohol dehydrogenase catalytic domain-containing protein [Dehalococcoidales bacterium]